METFTSVDVANRRFLEEELISRRTHWKKTGYKDMEVWSITGFHQLIMLPNMKEESRRSIPFFGKHDSLALSGAAVANC